MSEDAPTAEVRVDPHTGKVIPAHEGDEGKVRKEIAPTSIPAIRAETTEKILPEVYVERLQGIPDVQTWPIKAAYLPKFGLGPRGVTLLVILTLIIGAVGASAITFLLMREDRETTNAEHRQASSSEEPVKENGGSGEQGSTKTSEPSKEKGTREFPEEIVLPIIYEPNKAMPEHIDHDEIKKIALLMLQDEHRSLTFDVVGYTSSDEGTYELNDDPRQLGLRRASQSAGFLGQHGPSRTRFSTSWGGNDPSLARKSVLKIRRESPDS